MKIIDTNRTKVKNLKWGDKLKCCQDIEHIVMFIANVKIDNEICNIVCINDDDELIYYSPTCNSDITDELLVDVVII